MSLYFRAYAISQSLFIFSDPDSGFSPVNSKPVHVFVFVVKLSVHSVENGYPCKALNWTYKSYSQWSLSPTLNNTTSVWIFSSGASYSQAARSATVRPAFYLKAGITLSGTGAENDEFTIQ